MAEPLLRLRGVSAFYGAVQALFDVDLEVHRGEVVCLLGGNASGKSTTMKAIIGTLTVARGEIEFAGKRIERWTPGARVRAGLAIVPEARRIFPEMSVRENLEMGAFTRTGSGRRDAGPRPGADALPASAESASGRTGAPCRGASSRCWPWDGP